MPCVYLETAETSIELEPRGLQRKIRLNATRAGPTSMHAIPVRWQTQTRRRVGWDRSEGPAAVASVPSVPVITGSAAPSQTLFSTGFSHGPETFVEAERLDRQLENNGEEAAVDRGGGNPLRLLDSHRHRGSAAGRQLAQFVSHTGESVARKQAACRCWRSVWDDQERGPGVGLVGRRSRSRQAGGPKEVCCGERRSLDDCGWSRPTAAPRLPQLPQPQRHGPPATPQLPRFLASGARAQSRPRRRSLPGGRFLGTGPPRGTCQVLLALLRLALVLACWHLILAPPSWAKLKPVEIPSDIPIVPTRLLLEAGIAAASRHILCNTAPGPGSQTARLVMLLSIS